MAWTLYAYTRGGISLYEGSYASENAAAAAADKAVANGYLELPDVGAGPAWMIPFASTEIMVLYLVEETDPGANAGATDIIDGIDI